MSRAGAAALIVTLLLSTLAATNAGGQAAGWKIDDPPADLHLAADAGPGAPATAASNHLDLRSVSVSRENEVEIVLTVQVENLRVAPKPQSGQGFAVQCAGGSSSSSGSGDQWFTIKMEFALADTPFRYTLSARILGGYPDNGGNGFFVAESGIAFLCLHTDQGGERIYQRVPLSLEPNLIHVAILKEALLGQLPRPEFPTSSPKAKQPADLKVGDRLSKFTVRTDGQSAQGSFFDKAPNTGAAPDYVVKAPTANSVVRLAPSSGNELVPISEGNQSVSLLMSNRADVKRLVRLTYDVHGPEAARIRVSGPAAVTIARAASQNFSVAVDVEGAAPFQASPQVTVRGESIGYPGEISFASLTLTQGQVLSPVSNQFFLHASKELSGLQKAAESCQFLVAGACRLGLLSTQEADPDAASPNEFTSSMFPGGASTPYKGYAAFHSNRVIAQPFALAGGQPIELELKTATAQPADVQVKATLSYSNTHQQYSSRGDATLASGGASGSTGSVLRIPLTVPSLETTVVPAGMYFRLQVELSFPASAGTPTAATTGVKIIGKESRLRFPLVPVPDGAATALQGTFQLRASQDGQEFVNPGEARILNVSVLNQAPDNRSLRLFANASNPAWAAQTLPSDVFNLHAGDTIRIGVRVTAAAAAKEGEHVTVWLNATDERGKPSSLRLGIIATTGVDLPNEAGPYVADPDVNSKIRPAPPTDTPWPAMPLLLGAIGLAILISPRRRNR